MASYAVIEYQNDPATGQKSLVIKYLSEPDALPIEHEEEHKNFVKRLVGNVPMSRDGGSSGGGGLAVEQPPLPQTIKTGQ
jgi:hypothetical protein